MAPMDHCLHQLLVVKWCCTSMEYLEPWFKRKYTPVNLTVATGKLTRIPPFRRCISDLKKMAGFSHCHVRPYQMVGNLTPLLPEPQIDDDSPTNHQDSSHHKGDYIFGTDLPWLTSICSFLLGGGSKTLRFFLLLVDDKPVILRFVAPFDAAVVTRASRKYHCQGVASMNFQYSSCSSKLEGANFAFD